MCGITGLWTRPETRGATARDICERMTRALVHRGPDDSGHWTSEDGSLALGHRRLSVVDLSAAGHQPMQSATGRFTIVFNGEIYNHARVRLDLEQAGAQRIWRGHSDTETLLAAIERWGLEPALQRTEGMFAFALWDAKERCLHLARDRFGEKPLYYGWSSDGFLFASELKALRAHPGFRAVVCSKALTSYLRFAYVPAPASIFEGVYKLEPGCTLTVRGQPPPTPPADPLSAPAVHGTCTLARWWSLRSIVETASHARLLDDGEAVTQLEERLGEAVRKQMVADVPLGAFLSGGVDSSLIVALMQRQTSRRVQTFTIGFSETEYDESREARQVATHLGTEHHSLEVTPQDAMDVIPKLPHMYDEPFADSSQIPTHLVCCAARSGVTVALSGDGGDELFGGYNRYLWAPRVWRHMAWLPFAARQAVGASLRNVAWATERTGFAHGSVRRPAEKLRKLASAMHGVHSMNDLYRNLVSCWPAPSDMLARGRAGAPGESDWLPAAPLHGVEDPREKMMYWDAMTYLTDDILCKVDRAAMAISLETRAPFLDPSVAELAWRLPMHLKIRGGETKWILRQVLDRHVPRELVERPKTGFSVPLGTWLRGPLRAWAEELLDERQLAAQGYLAAAPIRTAWAQHLRGDRDWSQRLWSVLMFQAWLKNESL